MKLYQRVIKESGGGSAVLIEKSVTANDVYNASDDSADGYSRVTVNVQPDLTTKTITENGTYAASSENKDGYSQVTVNVPIPVNKFKSLVNRSITEVTAEDLAGIKRIGSYKFYSCYRLARVTLPEGIKHLEDRAFLNCPDLVKVTLPSTTLSIYDYAFYQCSLLTNLTIYATTPPTLINTNALTATNTNLVIYVPAASVSTYQGASNWSSFATRIQAIPT